MVELGGNIEIIGFEGVEPGKLIVVKKIIGNFAKKAAEDPEFKKLILELIDEKSVKIKVKLIAKEEKIFEAQDPNLFFALHKALEGLEK
tara:strand:+ start:15207 stop:15473 length:267 start_codon:yes stop_codon:yes gene_type:complete